MKRSNLANEGGRAMGGNRREKRGAKKKKRTVTDRSQIKELELRGRKMQAPKCAEVRRSFRFLRDC